MKRSHHSKANGTATLQRGTVGKWDLELAQHERRQKSRKLLSIGKQGGRFPLCFLLRDLQVQDLERSVVSILSRFTVWVVSDEGPISFFSGWMRGCQACPRAFWDVASCLHCVFLAPVSVASWPHQSEFPSGLSILLNGLMPETHHCGMVLCFA